MTDDTERRQSEQRPPEQVPEIIEPIPDTFRNIMRAVIRTPREAAERETQK